MEKYLYPASLLIVALVTLSAIYSRKFFDNLGQRIGLCVVCFGASIRLLTYLDGNEPLGPRYLFTYGVALFCLSTFYKFWRQK